MTRKMKPLTAIDLEKMIADINDELNTAWAVYGDYDEHLRWSVVKIIPWAERDEGVVAMRINGAVDALDAYKKVMERLA